jgi:two-component system, cell cycle sensor histidine kinase and response regulator CckA
MKTAKEKLLILDDELLILRSLEHLLEDDYEVFTTGDAQTALGLAREHDIAVILCDERMPEISGHEFLSCVRDVSKATRIMITGYADMSALAEAVNSGQIFAYIAKPWEPLKLKAAVAAAEVHFKLVREVDQERALLRALMENIPDLIFFKDCEFRFTRVNQALTRILGASDSNECVGRSDSDYFESGDADRWRRQEEELMRSGLPQIDQIERFDKVQGAHSWMSITKVPMFDRNGQVSGIAGIARDITALKNSEEMIRRSEQSLAYAQQIAQLGNWEVALTGPDAVPLEESYRCSEELYRIYGVDPQTFHANLSSFFQAVHPEDHDAVLQANDCARATGKPFSNEHRIIRGDGTVRYVLEQVVITLDGNQRPVAMIGTVQDMTERRELEEQFHQAQRLESVGLLAGGVAHDFNNLLSVINGYSYMMLMDLAPESPHYERVSEINLAGERAAALTSQLLAFSRKQVVIPTVVCLNDSILEIKRMITRIIGEDIHIVTNLSPEAGNVMADAGQIQQIVMNLAVNARDAMRLGGTLRIETTTETFGGDTRGGGEARSGHFMLLTVADTGIGMTEDIRTRIFEPFFTTKDVGKGTGLGLATVYGIVKQVGGWVEVLSKPGEGATFKIYLPRIGEPVTADRQAVRRSTSGSEAILVVEDQAEVRAYVVAALKLYGYSVFEAGGAQDAYRIWDSLPQAPAMVVTDVVMLGANGRNLARELREKQPDLRVLYMSGYPDLVMEQHALERGSGYIDKPFGPEPLAAKIREILDFAWT